MNQEGCVGLLGRTGPDKDGPTGQEFGGEMPTPLCSLSGTPHTGQSLPEARGQLVPTGRPPKVMSGLSNKSSEGTQNHMGVPMAVREDPLLQLVSFIEPSKHPV